jgi:polar amino acid transport system substrate-binding protein
MRSLLLLLLAVGLAPAHAGATLDRVKRTGIVTNVLLDTYPPFEFLGSDNQLAGFDVDVARAFAAKIGAKLQLQTPSWETIVSGHWQGRWDICICSMTRTAERTRTLSFPVQYYASPAVITVNKDEQHIKSAADLSGKRVGVGNGSTYENYLNRALVLDGQPVVSYPFHDVIAVPGDETINFRNLALGPGVRLDAIVSSFATATASAAALPALRILAPPLYAERSSVATEKGDPEWDALVARSFQELKADGTLAKISQKWLGVDAIVYGP